MMAHTSTAAATLRVALLAFSSGLVVATLYEKYKGQKSRKSDMVEKNQNAIENSEEGAERQGSSKGQGVIMDSPELSHRILRKAEHILQCRTSRIVVVVERCTNDHNYSAILRTCEALGIQNVYLISPKKPESDMVAKDEDVTENGEVCVEDTNQVNSSEHETETKIDEYSALHTNVSKQMEEGNLNGQKSKSMLVSSTGKVVKDANLDDVNSRKMHHLFAQRAAQWLTIQEFDSTESCIEKLHQEGRTIWVTDLSQEAVLLTRHGLLSSRAAGNETNIDDDVIPQSLAIVFGTEAVGCTQLMLQSAHRQVYLPMYGFADSLNLSVATALCLQQIFHLCPSVIGDMAETERAALRETWYTKLASQRITTTGERKRRARLICQIENIREIERKAAARGIDCLHKEQKEKLEKLPEAIAEHNSLERTIQSRARLAVQSFLDHPPDPIGDVRRADVHRVCYVGSGTRKKYKEIWKDMAAVKNESGAQCSTAEEFRDLLKAAEQNIDS
jgi:tRNA G18 (ribose-2'-O)-methylase SpoU